MNFFSGFDQKTFKQTKRKREQNDENEQAKLLKSSGYEDFINGEKKQKKFKSDTNTEDVADKKFSVKFEKKSTKSKPAKFLKISNKKASNK